MTEPITETKPKPYPFVPPTDYELRPDIAPLCPLLYHLTTLPAVPIVIEIGCATLNGSSEAFRQAVAAKDGYHLSVDIHDENDYLATFPWFQKFNQMTNAVGSRWLYLQGSSLEATTVTLAEDAFVEYYGTPHIIYIDTDHTYEQVTGELDNWREVGGKETLWLFHDTWMNGRPQTGEGSTRLLDGIMDGYAKYFAETHDYVDLATFSHGLGAFVPREGWAKDAEQIAALFLNGNPNQLMNGEAATSD